ncbi:MAG: hypothetical protein RLZZ77_1165 [Bacteroidota bacterium]|jgi:uncharacterized SAM-binding protein YcdF (DUF218 family)
MFLWLKSGSIVSCRCIFSPMKKWWQKKWVKALVIVSVLLIGLFLFRNPILRGLGVYLVSDNPLEKTDAICVLGGNSFERGLEGAEVYKQFTGTPVIATGGNFPLQIQAFDTLMTEAQLTRLVLEKHGVPDSMIVTLNGSTSTMEESDEILAYCKEHQLKKITLISSTFHLRRIRWVFEEKFQEAGIEVRLHGATDKEFDAENWWKNEQGLITTNNEYIKLLYYIIKY